MALQRRNLHLVLFLILKSIQLTSSNFVQIYPDTYLYGNSETKYLYECRNIYRLVGKCSSIDLFDSCVRLYDEFGCNGTFVEILPRSPAQHDLSIWNFDKKCKSTAPCECPLQISDDQVQVTLFSQRDFLGSLLDITVKGCTKIPTKYHNHTRSVDIKGNCVQLYNSSECIDEDYVDTIELSPGSPYHEDLHKYWKFPVAKAISRCDYKCSDNSFVIPKHGDVFLFQNQNFSGEFYNYSSLNIECMNFSSDWEGLAQSIGLGYNTCVILFDRRECSSDSRQLMINDSVSMLNTIKFGVRSIGTCEPSNGLIETTQISPPIILTTTTQMPNNIGNDTRYNKSNHNPKPDSHTLSTILIAVVVVVPIAVVALSAIVVFGVLKHCNPCRKEGGKLSEKEIREFLSGMGIDLMANVGSGSTRNANDYSTEFLAQNNAYNMDYEIARSNIEIDPGALLGAGEFGMVYKGKLALANERENLPSTSRSEKTTVAIKTVNQTSGLNGVRSLLKEVKVMLYMGQHTNIAKLIGCCTDKIRDGDLMVVLEYCSEGSMESYLKKNRLSFNNLVSKGKLEAHEPLSSGDTKDTETPRFDTLLMVRWCLEIARGMEFLSNAKVVHSDLAARNILLNDQLVAKISDFGLSRQLYAYSQYMKKHQEPLPFRWMAIESLKGLEFSTKSDVWSYGVLIWEIFSLGEKPYPGLGWNEAFISNLESGLRLAKPKNSTNELYNLMLRCWDENPAGRPSFTEIVEEIQEMEAGFSSDAYTTL